MGAADPRPAAGGSGAFQPATAGDQGHFAKVLSQTLKKLERDGLISRQVFPTVPVTVEYSLTPLGRTLTDTVAALAHWAEGNIDAVMAAQRAYDERAVV